MRFLAISLNPFQCDGRRHADHLLQVPHHSLNISRAGDQRYPVIADF
jgi:hypothetical protein